MSIYCNVAEQAPNNLGIIAEKQKKTRANKIKMRIYTKFMIKKVS